MIKFDVLPEAAFKVLSCFDDEYNRLCERLHLKPSVQQMEQYKNECIEALLKFYQSNDLVEDIGLDDDSGLSDLTSSIFEVDVTLEVITFLTHEINKIPLSFKFERCNHWFFLTDVIAL